MIENKVYELVRSKTKSHCRKVLRDEVLYIQPDDDRDIDTVAAGNLESSHVFQENSLDLEFEPKAIDDLFPELKKKTVTRRNIAIREVEEPKSALESIVQENEVDRKVFSALQSANLKVRTEPPEEFFIAYIDPAISFPIFLIYLLMIVLVNTWSAFFGNT
eukprot:TRINITY_DN15512_c0_g4_i3.p1 TRINITY_DN15512_c0_g4~~TRINITY_DN15512_c0_g4_i3.p1  ORF type:complete len:161 (+),score=25.56 TRINITY_DN15512_c0_g4_i3:151-633(+)